MTRQRILLILQTALLIQLALSGVPYVISPAVASVPDDFDQAVVKIESEKNRTTGAGVVICIEGNTASIITAAHVVTGDQVVRVSIAPREDITYQAQVKKVDNRDNGLALIVLQDEVVRKLSKLDFDTVDPEKGDAVITIGFPGSTGPWGHMPGKVSAKDGLIIQLSNHTEEGNSGGPVINEQSRKAVGLVLREEKGLGHALPSSTIRATLAGWGLSACITQYSYVIQYSYVLSGKIQYYPCGSKTLTTYRVDETTTEHALRQFADLYGRFANVSIKVTQLTNRKPCASGVMENSPHQHMHPSGLPDDPDVLSVGAQGTPGPYFKGGWQTTKIDSSGCTYMHIFLEPSTACDDR